MDMGTIGSGLEAFKARFLYFFIPMSYPYICYFHSPTNSLSVSV